MAAQDILNQYNALNPQLQSANQDYQNSVAGAGQVGQMIKNNMLKQYGNFSQNIGDAANAKADWMTAGPNASAQFQNIANPFTRNQMRATQVADAQRKYDTLSGVNNVIFDNLDKVINNGVNGYQSVLQGKKAGLDALQNQGDNLLKQYGLVSDNEYKNRSLGLQSQQLKAAQDAANAEKPTDQMLRDFILQVNGGKWTIDPATGRLIQVAQHTFITDPSGTVRPTIGGVPVQGPFLNR